MEQLLIEQTHTKNTSIISSVGECIDSCVCATITLLRHITLQAFSPTDTPTNSLLLSWSDGRRWSNMHWSIGCFVFLSMLGSLFITTLLPGIYRRRHGCIIVGSWNYHCRQFGRFCQRAYIKLHFGLCAL